MDFRSGTIALVALLGLFALLSVRSGLRAIQSARKMTFYHLRRQRQAGGWRLLSLAVILVVIAAALPIYGLPIAYEYFPPSPTPTLTPTKTKFATTTVTPTITSTPTITDTALVSDTPTASPTPFIPAAIEALFNSAITPNPKTVFSSLSFSTIISNYQAVNPSTVFQNPVGHIYGTYSYDLMQPGTQWTALWIHEGQLVHYQTKPFAGGTGGYDLTDWDPSPDQWLPGIYEVQLFVGLDLKDVGRFLVQGNPPTPVPSITPTSTKEPTITPNPSLTPTPSRTPRPSSTPHLTSTP